MSALPTTNAPRPSSPAFVPTIQVRRMDFEFGEQVPDFWFDDNPVLSALLAALSVSFPPGERYFIDSVRHYLPQIDDPELRERIRGFAGQEAAHTKEHVTFNEFLESRGYPAKAMEDFVRRRIAVVQAKSTPAENLARTAALEHFTAIIASAMLEHPEVLERMHPDVRAMWAWHAIEEIEHRSVAFDVYKRVVDDEGLRLRSMAVVTVLFTLVNFIRTQMLLYKAGRLFDVRSWARARDVLWGERTGVLRSIAPLYRAYYRRDFHPDEHDNRAELEAAKARFLGAKA